MTSSRGKRLPACNAALSRPNRKNLSWGLQAWACGTVPHKIVNANEQCASDNGQLLQSKHDSKSLSSSLQLFDLLGNKPSILSNAHRASTPVYWQSLHAERYQLHTCRISPRAELMQAIWHDRHHQRLSYSLFKSITSSAQKCKTLGSCRQCAISFCPSPSKALMPMSASVLTVTANRHSRDWIKASFE